VDNSLPYEWLHLRNGLQTCLGLAEARGGHHRPSLGALKTNQPTSCYCLCVVMCCIQKCSLSHQ
jgi:hypothetical protein